MADPQQVLDGAVAQGAVPFVVAMSASSAAVTGSWAAGEAAPGRAAAEDTVFRIYSMTKAIGAAAAMVLIDRGDLTMDTPVASVLPEWDALRVLDGFDGDEPVLRAPTTVATVRHLASHTSGLEYETWNPDIPNYMAATDSPSVMSGRRAAIDGPLTSDPGTRWRYGTGVDWLGLVVEAVAGRPIDDFCRTEIFEPLGMHDTDFEPDRLGARVAAMWRRNREGALVPFEAAPPANPEFYGMGHALYSTAPDYLRFLRMVLRGGELDGERVLSGAAVANFLADQLSGLTVAPMTSVSPASADVDLFPGTTVTHSFGFVRNEDDIDGRRRAGSSTWAGLANTHYWLDPTSDVAAVFMTQAMPFGDPKAMDAYEQFERAVYEQVG